MNDDQQLAESIAQQLGEPNVKLIELLVTSIGQERALAILAAALDTERGGGLMVNNGTRRRTMGGVFFYTARGKISKQERDAIFPRPPKRKGSGQGGSGAETAVESHDFAWAVKHARYIQHVITQKGIATVKITLIGRPTKTANAGTCQMLAMQSKPCPPSMPVGLPLPPTDKAQEIVVFVGAKQWTKASDALKKDKDDELIIEGWGYADTAKNLMVVLAQSCSTKNIQRGLRKPVTSPAAS